ISVPTHLQPEQSLRIFLPGLVELAEWHFSFSERDDVQVCDRFAVQPVGAPVRGQIAAVTPDRALLHTAHRLPDALTTFDIRAGEEHLAGLALDRLGNRRGGLIDLAAEIQQRREHHHHARCKNYPKPPDRKELIVVGVNHEIPLTSSILERVAEYQTASNQSPGASQRADRRR